MFRRTLCASPALGKNFYHCPQRSIQFGRQKKRQLYNVMQSSPKKSSTLGRTLDRHIKLPSPSPVKYHVPVSRLTHPQRKLVAPFGKTWTEIDTSFCDTDEFATQEIEVEESNAKALSRCEQITQNLREYLTVERVGEWNGALLHEKNSGPRSEDVQRRAYRRRTWVAARKAFVDHREKLFPNPIPAKSLGAAFDLLVALHASDQFRPKEPTYEEAEKFIYDSLNLSREVNLFFSSGGFSAQLASPIAHLPSIIVSLATLSVTYQVPWPELTYFALISKTWDTALLSPVDSLRLVSCSLNLPVIEFDCRHLPIATGINILCESQLAGGPTAIEHYTVQHQKEILNFCVKVRQANPFSAPELLNSLAQMIVRRIEMMLYQKESLILPEDARVAFYELREKSSEIQRINCVVPHAKLGLTFVDGLSTEKVGTRHSTELLRLLEEWRNVADSKSTLSTLEMDLVLHCKKLASTTVSTTTFSTVIFVLRALQNSQRFSTGNIKHALDLLDSICGRHASLIESLSELNDLLTGFHNLNFCASSRLTLEAQALRLLPSENTQEVDLYRFASLLCRRQEADCNRVVLEAIRQFWLSQNLTNLRNIGYRIGFLYWFNFRYPGATESFSDALVQLWLQEQLNVILPSETLPECCIWLASHAVPHEHLKGILEHFFASANLTALVRRDISLVAQLARTLSPISFARVQLEILLDDPSFEFNGHVKIEKCVACLSALAASGLLNTQWAQKLKRKITTFMHEVSKFLETEPNLSSLHQYSKWLIELLPVVGVKEEMGALTATLLGKILVAIENLHTNDLCDASNPFLSNTDVGLQRQIFRSLEEAGALQLLRS